MKIFYLRHQAAGILHEFPFSSPPTDDQLAPIQAMLLARHGLTHPKTKEAYWTMVVESEVIGANAMPSVDMPEEKSNGRGGGIMGMVEASGSGHVANPK